MQFKQMGKRIQVLAYQGYDREKRRPIVKLLGSFHAETGELGDKLKYNLTEEQKKEVLSYIKKTRQEKEQHELENIAVQTRLNMERLAQSINAGHFKPDATWAALVWGSIDVLGQAIRRAGCPRPPKPKKQAPKATTKLPGQMDLPNA